MEGSGNSCEMWLTDALPQPIYDLRVAEDGSLGRVIVNVDSKVNNVDIVRA